MDFASAINRYDSDIENVYTLASRSFSIDMADMNHETQMEEEQECVEDAYDFVISTIVHNADRRIVRTDDFMCIEDIELWF